MSSGSNPGVSITNLDETGGRVGIGYLSRHVREFLEMVRLNRQVNTLPHLAEQQGGDSAARTTLPSTISATNPGFFLRRSF
jgi:hypothetical protein